MDDVVLDTASMHTSLSAGQKRRLDRLARAFDRTRADELRRELSEAGHQQALRKLDALQAANTPKGDVLMLVKSLPAHAVYQAGWEYRVLRVLGAVFMDRIDGHEKPYEACASPRKRIKIEARPTGGSRLHPLVAQHGPSASLDRGDARSRAVASRIG